MMQEENGVESKERNPGSDVSVEPVLLMFFTFGEEVTFSLHCFFCRFWTPNLNIQPYHVWCPIPLTELQTNPALLESDPTNNGYR